MDGKKPFRFDDGTTIEWVDRETLRFSDGDFSALIWVDFGPGLFSRERVLDVSRLKNWTTTPKGVSTSLTETDRDKILRRVEEYYRAHRTKLSVIHGRDGAPGPSRL